MNIEYNNLEVHIYEQTIGWKCAEWIYNFCGNDMLLTNNLVRVHIPCNSDSLDCD